MRIDPTADDVVADMERIFKPLAGRSLVTAFHHDERPERARVVRGWRRVTLAAPAAVLLVAAALAIGYGRVNTPAVDSADATVAAPTLPTFSQPTASPSSVSVAALSTDTPPSADPPAAVDRQAFDPRPAAGLVRLPDAAMRPSEPAPDPRPAEAARPLAPAVAVTADPRPASAIIVASAPPRRRERAESPRAPRRCEPGSLEDHCIYQDVLRADARLRRSYDEAKRSGVSKLWLSTVSRRWQRAAEEAEDDPDRTVDRYGRLADALDRQRREIAR